ncbi:hypothetical protein HKI87_19g89500 [Chloropicon roscoffensis]|uniref:NADH dehydrogenase [ubiquinone] 1 alpha subcomplex subunit 1 n=1 Tax=Chloropicon roscoffensis TaxID=1461544 RepID=A0AAX4PLY2_9CHLO
MSGLASFGQVVPAIVGMMGCSFGVFYCVRNLKVLGGQCAGTYADPSWAMKTAQYIQKMPREGADSKVFMNPINKGHMPKTSTGATW